MEEEKDDEGVNREFMVNMNIIKQLIAIRGFFHPGIRVSYAGKG